MDFTKPEMHFVYQEQPITLRVCNSAPSLSFMSIDAVQRYSSNPARIMGFLFSIDTPPSVAISCSVNPLVIQQLLTDFEDIFREPLGLPPVRAHDHHTVFKGATPNRIRPYRYPQI